MPNRQFTELDTAGVVGAYKNLAGVEKDFRSLKAIDGRPLRQRPRWRYRRPPPGNPPSMSTVRGKPQTSTYDPCTTTWNTASKPTCSSVSSPRTSPTTSATPLDRTRFGGHPTRLLQFLSTGD